MSIRRKIATAGREDGQAAVELALVLPLLVILLLGVIQFGIAFSDYETLTDATRAGARQAVVARFAGSPAAAEQAVRDAAAGLDLSKLEVSVTSPDWTAAGSPVVVTATYPYSIDLLGIVVASGELTSTTTERLE